MLECSKCGKEVSPGQKFCTSCGSSVDHIQCPTCGTVLKSGVKFCFECGRNMLSVDSSSGSSSTGKKADGGKRSQVSAYVFLALLLLALIIPTTYLAAESCDSSSAISTTTTTTRRHTTRRTTTTTKPTTTTTTATTTTDISKKVWYADNYKVGVDIPAGTYVLYDVSSYKAYMCISSDANQDKIVKNDNFSNQLYITIKDGQYLELSRCVGVLAEGAPAAEPDSDGYLEDGMYKVGYDLPAGEYKLEATSDYGGYYAIYDKPLGKGKIKSNDNFDNKKYVKVKDGQYLYLSRCRLKVS